MGIFDWIIDWFKPKPKPPTPPTPPPVPVNDILSAHNKERAKAFREPFKEDSRLTAAAQKHADWMAKNRRMSHTGANGSEVWDRSKAEGYQWRWIGENIAQASDLSTVMSMWMNSTGHRSNILSANFHDVGFGRSGQYWCVVFGSLT